MQHIRNWALFGLIALGMGVHAANPGDKAEAVNMRLVGYSDLQARTAYQPTIQKQGQRWIAYVGHHGDFKLNPLTGQMEDNGTSILDVTDPKKPQYLAHLPGGKGKAEQGGAQMVRICSGADLPKADKSKFYMLRVFGNQAHEIWDVTDPAKPALLTTIVKGLNGTHKNFWECDSGIALLAAERDATADHDARCIAMNDEEAQVRLAIERCDTTREKFCTSREADEAQLLVGVAAGDLVHDGGRRGAVPEGRQQGEHLRRGHARQ